MKELTKVELQVNPLAHISTKRSERKKILLTLPIITKKV